MNRGVLRIDAAAETDRIVQWLKETMRGFHRSGAVLGISGGIDSSVCLALCVKAFGPERVVPLLLPDKDSDPISEDLARDAGRPLRRHPRPGDRHAGPGRVRLLRTP